MSGEISESNQTVIQMNKPETVNLPETLWKGSVVVVEDRPRYTQDDINRVHGLANEKFDQWTISKLGISNIVQDKNVETPSAKNESLNDLNQRNLEKAEELMTKLSPKDRLQKTIAKIKLSSAGVKDSSSVIRELESGLFLRDFLYQTDKKSGDYEQIEKMDYTKLYDKRLIRSLSGLENPTIALQRLNRLAPIYSDINILEQDNVIGELNRLSNIPQEIFDEKINEFQNDTYVRPFNYYVRTSIGEELRDTFDLFDPNVNLPKDLKEKLELAKILKKVSGSGSFNISYLKEIDIEDLQIVTEFTEKYDGYVGREELESITRQIQSFKTSAKLDAVRFYLKENFSDDKWQLRKLLDYDSLNEDEKEKWDANLSEAEEFLSDDAKTRWLHTLEQSYKSKGRSIVEDAKETFDERKHFLAASIMLSEGPGSLKFENSKDILSSLIVNSKRYGTGDLKDFEPDGLFVAFMEEYKSIFPEQFDFSGMDKNQLTWSSEVKTKVWDKYISMADQYRKIQSQDLEAQINIMENMRVLSKSVVVNAENSGLGTQYKEKFLNILLSHPDMGSQIIPMLPQSDEEYQSLKTQDLLMAEGTFTNFSFIEKVQTLDYSPENGSEFVNNFEYIKTNILSLREKLGSLGFDRMTALNNTDYGEYVWLDKLPESDLKEVSELIISERFAAEPGELRKIREYLSSKEVLDLTYTQINNFFGEQRKHKGLPEEDYWEFTYDSSRKFGMSNNFEEISKITKNGNLDKTLDVVRGLWKDSFESQIYSLKGISDAIASDVTSEKFLDVCNKLKNLQESQNYFENFWDFNSVAKISRMNPQEQEGLFEMSRKIHSFGGSIFPTDFDKLINLWEKEDRESVLSYFEEIHSLGINFSFENLNKAIKVFENGHQEKSINILKSFQENGVIPGYDYLVEIVSSEKPEDIMNTAVMFHRDLKMVTPQEIYEAMNAVSFIEQFLMLENKDQYKDFFKNAADAGYPVGFRDWVSNFSESVKDSQELQRECFALMKSISKLDSLQTKPNITDYGTVKKIYDSLPLAEEGEKAQKNSRKILNHLNEPDLKGISININDVLNYSELLKTGKKSEEFAEYIRLLRKTGYGFHDRYLSNFINLYKTEEWPQVQEFVDFYARNIDKIHYPDEEISSSEIHLNDEKISDFRILLESGISKEDLFSLAEKSRRSGANLGIYRNIAKSQIFSSGEILGQALSDFGVTTSILDHAKEQPEVFQAAFPSFAKAFVQSEKKSEKDEVLRFKQALQIFSEQQIDPALWALSKDKLPSLLEKSGKNSSNILELTTNKENADQVNLLSQLDQGGLIQVSSPDDFNTFKKYSNEIGIFYSPMIFTMYKYLDQGEKGDFPEHFTRLGINKETKNKKEIFIQEIQRFRRDVVVTGQLKDSTSQIEREVLMVEGKFNSGRFRRSGNFSDINYVVENYYKDQAGGLISPLPDRYKMQNFEMDILIKQEVNPSAKEQALKLMDQVDIALTFVDKPVEEVISSFSVSIAKNISEKMTQMSSTLLDEENNFQKRSSEKPDGFSEEKEKRRLEGMKKNIETTVESYAELLKRIKIFETTVRSYAKGDLNDQNFSNEIKGLSSFEQVSDKDEDIINLRNQTMQSYLKMLLNFEEKYMKKGSPQLADAISSLTMLHAFENDHELGISHDTREEMLQLTKQETINLSTINTLAEFIGVTVKEHSLEITNLTSEQKQRVMKTLNTNSLKEAIENYTRSVSNNKKTITCIPTRGVLAELSGDLADACWVRTPNIMKDNPNMQAVIFVENAENPSKTKSIGSCLLIETTAEGHPAIIIRGLNPRQELFDEGGSPLSFFNEFVDTYVTRIAQELGNEKGVNEVYIICPEPGTGALSNRPAFKLETVVNDVTENKNIKLDTPNTFNGYNITDRCLMVKNVTIRN